MEERIWQACNGDEQLRDFSEEEHQYIILRDLLKEDLLGWYWSSLSDGCWTENNRRFLQSLSDGVRTGTDNVQEDEPFVCAEF